MNKIEIEIAKYFFSSNDFWDHMPLSVYKSLKADSTTVKYKKNEIMYREGNYPKGLYIIKKGLAKLSIVNSDGREQIIYLLQKNDFYGYRSLINQSSTIFFITALEDCEVEIINKEIFLTQLHESLVLNKLLLNHIGNEYKVLMHKIAFFTLKPVNERIALTLLVLDLKFKSAKKNKNELISKADIANFAGTIPETLSRQLKILKDQGIIAVAGRKINILKTEQLIEWANIV